jgi:hypothetical protein
MRVTISNNNILTFISFMETIANIGEYITLAFKENEMISEGYCDSFVSFYEISIHRDFFSEYSVDIPYPAENRSINFTICNVCKFIGCLKLVETNMIYIDYNEDVKELEINGHKILVEEVKFNKTNTNVFDIEYKLFCTYYLDFMISSNKDKYITFQTCNGVLTMTHNGKKLNFKEVFDYSELCNNCSARIPYIKLKNEDCSIEFDTEQIQKHIKVQNVLTEKILCFQNNNPLIIMHNCEYIQLQFNIYISPRVDLKYDTEDAVVDLLCDGMDKMDVVDDDDCIDYSERINYDDDSFSYSDDSYKI